ncbi:MAG: hypothetical protein AAGB51_13545 [Planctomycetota bacterium]
MRHILAIVFLAVTAASAIAQTREETFNYQGVLENNGAPFSGTVDLSFSFYDRPTGGTLLGTDTAEDVQVENGLFFAEFLLPSPAALTPIWLEIRIAEDRGPGTALSPRQRLRPAPIAANTTGAEKLADGTVVFQRQSSLTTAENDAGNDIKSATAATQTFIAARSGRLQLAVVLVAGGSLGTATIYDGPDTKGEILASASISGFEFPIANFNTTSELIAGQTYTVEAVFPEPLSWFTSDSNPYPDGQSSFGPANDLIFQIDVESPDVPIASVNNFGLAELRQLNVTGSGDTAVQLPPNAINASELSNELGVAADFDLGSSLSTSLSAVAQRTIDVPAAGFVLASFTGELRLTHTTGSSSSVVFGVSNSPSSIAPTNNDMQVVLPSSLPSGTFEHSIAAQGLFPVSGAGLVTYYVIMDPSASTTAALEDYGFTLLYIPTAYGTTEFGSPALGPQPHDE